MIIIRTLRRDIARYNKDEDMVCYHFYSIMNGYFYFNVLLVKDTLFAKHYQLKVISDIDVSLVCFSSFRLE